MVLPPRLLDPVGGEQHDDQPRTGLRTPLGPRLADPCSTVGVGRVAPDLLTRVSIAGPAGSVDAKAGVDVTDSDSVGIAEDVAEVLAGAVAHHAWPSPCDGQSVFLNGEVPLALRVVRRCGD